MNVLVVAPHPDDESIGCGGAVCNHTSRGDRVTVVFLTSGELGLKQLPCKEAWRIREAEAREAATILGVAELFFLRQPDWYLGDNILRTAKALKPIFKRESPGLIYLPHAGEGHPDHQASLPIVRAALRRSRVSVPKLRAYEVWTPLSGHDHLEDISAVIERKREAMRAYRSQLKERNYERAIVGLNQYRGELAARYRFAEAFQNVDAKGG